MFVEYSSENLPHIGGEPIEVLRSKLAKGSVGAAGRIRPLFDGADHRGSVNPISRRAMRLLRGKTVCKGRRSRRIRDRFDEAQLASHRQALLDNRF